MRSGRLLSGDRGTVELICLQLILIQIIEDESILYDGLIKKRKRGQYAGGLRNHYSHYRFISSGLNWGIYIFDYSQVGENIHYFLGVGGFSMFSSTIVLVSDFC